MAKKNIKWGILGLGWMADKFVQDFNKLSGCKIVALGSRHVEKAKEFKTIHNLKTAKTYGNYEELCNDPELDIVYIATPHTLHMENTLMALESGKAVLCEKPLAVNSKQAELMLNTAREKKLFLMEAMWTAFLPVIQKVKTLLREDTIGTVKRITADFSIDRPWNPHSRLYDPGLAGGVLLDIGIYPLFLIQYLFGGDPEAVEAVARIGETGVDEHLAIILKYPDDRFALVSACSRFTTPCLARIEGTDGAIHIPKFWMADTAEIKRDGITSYRIEAPYSYHYQVQGVNECLRQGELESSVVPLKLSARIMRTMDIIREKIQLRYPFEQ